MEHLKDKVAFITGAASGIGFGIARACLRRWHEGRHHGCPRGRTRGGRRGAGRGPASSCCPWCSTLRTAGSGPRALTASVANSARVDLLCSNAGVNFVGPTHEATYEDWDFALGVNLGGAINAVRTFAAVHEQLGTWRPHCHHFIGQRIVYRGVAPGVYVTSKFALVGLAESLRADLRQSGVGVSVLCPGPVSRSSSRARSRCGRRGWPRPVAQCPCVPHGVVRADTPIFRTAPTGAEIGEYVLKGVRRNDLYILTHPEIRPVLEARAAALLRALPAEQSARSASSPVTAARLIAVRATRSGPPAS